MYIVGNEINYSTGKLLDEFMDELAFAKKIKESLSRNAKEVRNLTQSSTRTTTFRDEIECFVRMT